MHILENKSIYLKINVINSFWFDFKISCKLPILTLYLIQSKRRRNRGGLKPSCAQKNTCSDRISVYSRPR